ncbi:MAG TPA: biotin carboxylase N-terminal domain-containing protein [Mycobacteriales bacterium]|nr:biotin carboxylase N-terminal domain-containing protein [Mycobacteriales bacterium]
MFETVLVADRGVTALRVLRACQRLDVLAVAVHADDDARLPHVQVADDAVPLGGRALAETYGDRRKLLEAAQRSGAQAVHPGSGPLALDAQFAEDVQGAGLVWLGPPPEDLRPEPAAGPGRRAVAVVGERDGRPAWLGLRTRLGRVLDEQAGPVDPAVGAVLDRVAGTRGPAAWDVVLGPDGPAGAVPAPLLSPGCSATEAVSGVDLAALQLHLAAGDPPPPPGPGAGAAVALHVRVGESFAGRLRRFRCPEVDGVRSDVGVAEGSRLTAGTGRLLAVLTASGADRAQALSRAAEAVDAFEVSGVPTNLPLLREVVRDPSFVAGEPDDALLERTRRA